jgi:hypothetical protein
MGGHPLGTGVTAAGHRGRWSQFVARVVPHRSQPPLRRRSGSSMQRLLPGRKRHSSSRAYVIWRRRVTALTCCCPHNLVGKGAPNGRSAAFRLAADTSVDARFLAAMEVRRQRHPSRGRLLRRGEDRSVSTLHGLRFCDLASSGGRDRRSLPLGTGPMARGVHRGAGRQRTACRFNTTWKPDRPAGREHG